MSYNGRFPVPGGTVIARASCECCGGTVQIKVNKNGGAYYYCHGSDEQGVACCHSQRWGQRVSYALRKTFDQGSGEPFKVRLPIMISGKVPAEAAANDNRPPVANTNAPPQVTPKQASGGGLFDG